MKFKKGKYDGVWFIWPVVIYYRGLGLEIRFLKWLIGVDWLEHDEIKIIKPSDKYEIGIDLNIRRYDALH